MRFLQIVSSVHTSAPPANTSAPRDPTHMAKVNKSINEAIARGTLLATGALGKRATSAARIVHKDGKFSIEDPPKGDGWMAGGGYSLTEFNSKEEAIANAKTILEIMGDGMLELIQVGEMHPRPKPAGPPTSGVIPYLSMDGASEASAFYQKAFGAKEHARMHGQDGKRLMHCHLEINGGALMIADNFPEMGFGPVQRSRSDTMQLVVNDGAMWWSRAIKAGCKETLPFNVAPWGDRYGQMIDPFGVTWAILEPAKK
jgi:uncharacterized glyoxalase superfamily protein PhnB